MYKDFKKWIKGKLRFLLTLNLFNHGNSGPFTWACIHLQILAVLQIKMRGSQEHENRKLDIYYESTESKWLQKENSTRCIHQKQL